MKMKYALNGLILECADGDILFQRGEEYEDDIEAFADFLRTINDHYGPTTGRYSKKRIYVTIAPGDKRDD